MKLVQPNDPDLIQLMLAARDIILRLPHMLPLNDDGRAELLTIVQRAAEETCPHRCFTFRIEIFPGTYIANVVVEEPETKDWQ